MILQGLSTAPWPRLRCIMAEGDCKTCTQKRHGGELWRRPGGSFQPCPRLATEEPEEPLDSPATRCSGSATPPASKHAGRDGLRSPQQSFPRPLRRETNPSHPAFLSAWCSWPPGQQQARRAPSCPSTLLRALRWDPRPRPLCPQVTNRLGGKGASRAGLTGRGTGHRVVLG